MSSDGFVLREFAYFDRQKVEDFLSGIENGLSKETTETARQINAGMKGKVGLPGVVSLEADLGQKGTTLQELKTATDASLFQRLYGHLSKYKQIRHLETIDEEVWQDIKDKEMLELVGQIEPSTVQILIEMLKSVMPLVKFQKNARKNKEMLRMLTSFHDSINIKIMLGNYKFVASLPKAKMRVSQQELSARYSILCRVQRKLQKDETFDFFSFVPGIRFPREAVERMIETFPSSTKAILVKGISTEGFIISYPAMTVTPIAIYR